MIPATTILLLALAAGSPAAPSAPAPTRLTAWSGPVEDLRARADAERQAPAKPALDLPPPPGIDAAAAALLPELVRAETASGGMPIAEVLKVLAARGAPPALTPIAAGEPVDDETKAEVEKLYAVARQQLAEEKAADALATLQEAVGLDPSSAGLWREISRCQELLGRKAASLSALQQAVRRGLKDRSVRELLARESLRGLRTDEALWLLAELPRPADHAQAAMQDLRFAEALDRAGYARAASELFARGLSATELESAAKSNAEAAETLRRRGEYWQRAGDLAMRLGRVEDATKAYDAAAGQTMLDPGGLAVRRVFAAARLGRPAQAALSLVEKFERTGGQIEDRELALVRYLAERTDVGPQLAASLGAVLGEPTTASARSRVARLKAAALPVQDRRAALVDHLAGAPTDRGAAADLLATFGPAEFADRDRAMARIVEKRPLAADKIAAIIIADGRSVEASAVRLGQSSDTASRLLAAYLSFALGRGEDALAKIKPESAPSEMRAAVLGVKADVAGLVGDYAAAASALKALDEYPIELAREAKARALSALQRQPEALELVTSLENAPAADQRMLVANLALQSGRLDLAERILTRIAEEDPQEERSAEILMRLYSRGERADQRQFAAVVQRLRDRVSSSRVLRWAAANDLMQRSQWSAAEQTLLSLAEEDPTSLGLLDALATVWVRGGAGAMERGEAWLCRRLEAAPESAEATAALAQVLAGQGKLPEACTLLDNATKAHPIERLRRLRELITAETDAAEARRLTAARLAKTPRTIDNALNLIEALILQSKTPETTAVFRELPSDVPLTAEQLRRVSVIAGVMVRADADAVIAGQPGTSAELLPIFEKLGVQATPEIRESRLLLACLAAKPDLDTIAADYHSLAETSPQELAVLGRISQMIISTKRPAALIPFTEAVVTRGDSFPAQAMLTLSLAIGQFGDADDLSRVMPALTKEDRSEVLLDLMSTDGASVPARSRRPGAIAYRIAGFASNQERYEPAAHLYELAVSLDPTNAIAMNDYGYMLLEHLPQDRKKIETLLEKAYEIDATSYNIVDSLAWLRYKQGRFADDPAKGAIGGAGAVSLLKRAIELQDDEEGLAATPFIVDHYGDALWATGDKSGAIVAWQTAESRASALIRDAQGEIRHEDNSYVVHLKAVQQGAAAKSAAARENREPAIAPRWDPTPAPTPAPAPKNNNP